MKNELRLLKNNWVDYFSVVIFALGSGFVLLLQIYFHEVFHYSVLQAAIILGAAGSGQLIGSFCANFYLKLIKHLFHAYKVTARSATRCSLMLLSAATTILFILFTMNSYYLPFVFISFLLGITLSLFYPIIQSVLFENLSVSQAVAASSLKRLALNLGVGVSLTLISFVTHHPKILFLSIACLMLIPTLLFLSQLTKHSIFDSDDKTIKASNKFSLKFSKPIILWGITIFLGTAIFFQTISVYPMYLHDYYGIDTALFGRLMLINIFMVLAFQFVAPLVERKLGIHFISALGMGIMSVGIGMVLFHSFSIVILSFVIWSIGEIFYLGMITVYIKMFSINDPQKSLIYSSYYFFLFYLGKTLGPILGSLAYVHLQDKNIALIVIIIIGLLGMLPFLWLRDT